MSENKKLALWLAVSDEIERLDTLIEKIVGDAPKPGLTARTLIEIRDNLKAALR